MKQMHFIILSVFNIKNSMGGFIKYVVQVMHKWSNDSSPINKVHYQMMSMAKKMSLKQ